MGSDALPSRALPVEKRVLASRASYPSVSTGARASGEELTVFHATTIVCVRKDGKVCIAGDGQVTLDKTVMKATAKKVRRGP